MSLFQVMFRCCDALTCEGLEGAVYALCHCGRVLLSAQSDRRGICCFDGVAPGVYSVRESLAPPGYQSNPKSYPCRMDCNGYASIGGLPAHRVALIHFPVCGNGSTSEYGNGAGCKHPGITGFGYGNGAMCRCGREGTFAYGSGAPSAYGNHCGCGTGVPFGYGNSSTFGFSTAEPHVRSDSGFQVQRLSGEGEPMAGCILTLHSGGVLSDEAVSGEDGIAEFRNLGPGSYTLAERMNPDGKPLAVYHEVHITEQGVVRIDGVRTESITMR